MTNGNILTQFSVTRIHQKRRVNACSTDSCRKIFAYVFYLLSVKYEEEKSENEN